MSHTTGDGAITVRPITHHGVGSSDFSRIPRTTRDHMRTQFPHAQIRLAPDLPESKYCVRHKCMYNKLIQK